MTRPHVVRQGESLSSIAHGTGHTAQAIWDHDANQELRELRRHMDVLAPGDVVQIPTSQPSGCGVSAGESNRYRTTVPTIEMVLVLEEPDGNALADKELRVFGAGKPKDARTDGEGRVTLRVPVHVSELRVVVTDSGRNIRLRVGHLDPIELPSGVSQRLAHLGYRPGSGDAALRAAVTAFQHDQELTETGVVDDATRETLVREHGS